MQERLLQIGDWLAVNSEAIYGSKASPFWPRRFEWGSCTYQPARADGSAGERLFLVIHGDGGEAVALNGLENGVGAARRLADGAEVTVRRTARGIELPLPATPTPGLPWVVALELDGEPRVDNSIHQSADGSMRLRAKEAILHGSSPRYELGNGKDNIGYWGDPSDFVSWELAVTQPGTFEVEVMYSCAAGCAGSRFAVSIGERSLVGDTEETGTWTRFESQRVGRLRLEVGRHELAVRPVTPPQWKVMGLQAVVLRRVED